MYGAIAGILALRGKKKVQQATPPLPEETVQSVKEDVRYTKQRARRPGNEHVPDQQADPEQLRREGEEIRRELGETVAQLAHKADVKAQAREKVQEVKTSALRRTPHSARGGARRIEATGARSHPVPLATVGALLVGFLIGRRIGRRSA